MKQYLDLLRNIMENGVKRGDRTGTGTLSIFGTQSRYDLQKGFPLMTTKKVFFKGVLHELLWMLSGSTNVKYLQENGVRIWNEWADAESGELGPVYGAQWRSWKHWDKDNCLQVHDQIAEVIEALKNNPESRRHIVCAWNVGEIDQMALPCCHILFQFYVANGELSCSMYQRSADMLLGVPFNIGSYAVLTHMIAQVCGLKVGDFVHTIGDCHIYLNHIDQVKEQLTREPYELPTLWLNPEIKNIDDFKYEDVKVLNYKCHKTIKAPIAV